MARQPNAEKYRAAELHFARMDAEQHLSWRAGEDEFDRMFRQSTFAPLGGVFMAWVLIVRGSRRIRRWVQEMGQPPARLQLPPPLKALTYTPGLECPLAVPPSEPDERP